MRWRTVRKGGLAALCAAALLGGGCSTLQLRPTYRSLPENVLNAQRSLVTYTWNERGEGVYTNVFRPHQPLGLLYTAERKAPRDLSEKIRVRIERDDPNEAFYQVNEIILEPQHLAAHTNNLENVLYQYSFERAGVLSGGILGSARQYRLRVEYWGKGRNPQRFQLRELFYLIPVINMIFVFADECAVQSSPHPILAEQSITIID